MTDDLEQVPRLKSEAEFQEGLDRIGRLIDWFLMSEDIKGDLERQKARHEREDMYGRAHKEAV